MTRGLWRLLPLEPFLFHPHSFALPCLKKRAPELPTGPLFHPHILAKTLEQKVNKRGHSTFLKKQNGPGGPGRLPAQGSHRSVRAHIRAYGSSEHGFATWRTPSERPSAAEADNASTAG